MFVTFCTAISRIPLESRSVPLRPKVLHSVSILGFSSPRSTLPVSVSGPDTFADRSLRTPSAIASSSMFFDVSANCISSPFGAHLFVRCRLNFLIVHSVTLGELARGHIQNWPALSISALCPLSRTSRCICESLSMVSVVRLKKYPRQLSRHVSLLHPTLACNEHEHSIINKLSRTTPSNYCANAVVELTARSHARTPPNFIKHAQMCVVDNHFAQATTSCQPPQRLSARQHSHLLTSDGVWISLLRLANDKGHQVCRHLQAQHNNAVHASLVFYWSASVRWDVRSPSRTWNTLLGVIQSTAPKIPSRHHSLNVAMQRGQNYHGRNAYENILVGVPSPSLSTLTSPKPFFHFLVTRTILPQTRCRRHLEHNF